MKKPYHIVTRAARESAAVIEQFCQANGQILLSLVDLIQSASQVVETVIHEIGQQSLEMILELSAEQVAGPRTRMSQCQLKASCCKSDFCSALGSVMRRRRISRQPLPAKLVDPPLPVVQGRVTTPQHPLPQGRP